MLVRARPGRTGETSECSAAFTLADWGPSRNGVMAARFACGGSVAWAAVDDPAAFSTRLAALGLSGLVVRGAMAGARIGLTPSNSFEEHVRSVLDPRRRFS